MLADAIPDERLSTAVVRRRDVVELFEHTTLFAIVITDFVASAGLKSGHGGHFLGVFKSQHQKAMEGCSPQAERPDQCHRETSCSYALDAAIK